MKPTDGPRSFPRLADYADPPDVTTPDPEKNAHLLRHALKGKLNPLRLIAHTIRTSRDRLSEADWQEILADFDRSIEACIRDVELVRELPAQPQPQRGA